MLVIAGTTDANVVIDDNKVLADVELPRWILDKIIPSSFSTGQFVNAAECDFFTSSYSSTKKTITLLKIGTINIKLRISNVAGSFTLTSPTTFRIQFDLLIDNA